jgi:hypothetical protein
LIGPKVVWLDRPWYVWTADGKSIVKCRLYFSNLNLSSLSGILLTLLVLHTICGFCRQICMLGLFSIEAFEIIILETFVG